MEPENSASRTPARDPHRPGATPAHRPITPPAGRRPMIDGFGPHRPSMPPQSQRPTTPSPVPTSIPVQTRPSTPTPVPQAPHVERPAPPVQAASSAFDSRPTVAAAPRSQTPLPEQREFTPPPTDSLSPSSSARPPREHNRTGHAGLAGFVVFLLLTALLLSPFVPGKILQDFPLSSQGFSTGEQSLDCLGTQGNLNNVTAYDTKLGAPLTYNYSASTTQSATCDGKAQSAVVSSTSQFSPLALLVDIAVALVVAIIFARIWRLIFGEKRSKR